MNLFHDIDLMSPAKAPEHPGNLDLGSMPTLYRNLHYPDCKMVSGADVDFRGVSVWNGR